MEGKSARNALVSMQELLEVLVAEEDVPESLIVDFSDDDFGAYAAGGLNSEAEGSSLKDLCAQPSTRAFVDYVQLAVLLANCKRLLHLSLEECPVEVGIVVAQVLKHGSTLKSFNCSAARWTDDSALALAVALKKNTSLSSCTLNFGGSACTDVAGVAIADVLIQNSSLRSFTCLAGCSDIGCSWSDVTGIAMAEALKHNSALDTFELSGSRFSDLTGMALAQAIKQNSALKSIVVSCLRSSDRTGIALANALKQNAALERFVLCSLGFTDVTGIALAAVLKQGCNLKKFGLEGPRLSDRAGLALAEALGQNSTLTSFTFVAHCTGDVAVAFAAVLKQNSTLEEFCMEVFQFSDHAGVAMAEAIKQNVCLQRFSFKARWASAGDQTMLALADALRYNHVLQSCYFDAPLSSEKAEVSLAEAIKDSAALLSFSSKLKIKSCRIENALLHNRKLRRDRTALAAVSRPQCGAGFNEFKSMDFRQHVCSFLFPRSFDQSQSFAGAAMSDQVEQVSGLQVLGGAPEQSPAAGAKSAVDVEAKPDIAEERERESAELAQAIVHSKADLPATGMPLSSDGVIILRLTRHARSPEVIAALRGSEELEPCHLRVMQAGCELNPTWAGGATLLVPLTEEHFEDISVNLAHHHIVALVGDVPSVRSVLQKVSRSMRPKLSADHRATGAGAQGIHQSETSGSASQGSQPASQEGTDTDSVDVEVLHEFAPRTDSSFGFPTNPYLYNGWQ